jgi:mono/diheme cytochrome c family protein
VQGTVELKLAGKIVLEGKADSAKWVSSQPLELPFDRHELEVTYRRTGPRGQLALFWSGPDFRLEPIAERFLLHDRERTPPTEFERGRQLAAALRCAACHRDEAAKLTPVPALDRLSGNVHGAWLVDWLGKHAGGDPAQPLRRMPDFGLAESEAAAIAAWLLREPAIKNEVKLPPDRPVRSKANGSKKKKGDEHEAPRPAAALGERLLLTRGCLACHQLGELGESGLFGGGDLTQLARKRPADFLLRWLSDPAAINRSHRMPTFTFTPDELKSLDLWWRERGSEAARVESSARLAEGEKLVASLRCANCHLVKRDEVKLAAAAVAPLSSASNWLKTCAADADRTRLRPGFRLAAADQAALRTYYAGARPGEMKTSPQARGRDLLVEHNCLACHQREGVDRKVAGTLRVPSLDKGSSTADDGTRSVPTTLSSLQDKLASVAEAHGELAPLVPAMTPPALNGVGDKLHDAALADSIRRAGPPHRPYLLVQMPKFALTDGQLADLTAYFVATDRIPSVGNALRGVPGAGDEPRPLVAALSAAGPRLVTADGLSCTSCHQVGSVLPAKAPLNARGPDISMLEKRIRRQWYDRWCDNPARIVPRMEMPEVKIPVRGVLNEKVADQLAAVWHILNTPGFEPPEPNPVRVLRLSGVPERNERPIVIHDVVKDGDKTYLFPLVIGLPNRHNLLFDLETNRLAAWWLGDTARQRTKGKSWYWEVGAKSILDPGFQNSELSLVIGGKEVPPKETGQFASTLELYNRSGGEGLIFNRAMAFDVPAANANRAQSIVVTTFEGIEILSRPTGGRTGFKRSFAVTGVPAGVEAKLRILGGDLLAQSRIDPSSQTFHLPGSGERSIRVELPSGARLNGDGSIGFVSLPAGSKTDVNGFPEYRIDLYHSTTLPTDQFLAVLPAVPAATTKLELGLGLAAQVLPLDTSIMPSGFAWKPDGRLVFCTIKGEVFTVSDSDADGLPDQPRLLEDGLPTPYGVWAGEDYVDVIAKNGLLRLGEVDDVGVADRSFVVADGWGYTADYHDWSVGLLQGDRGEYYVALPCQQDSRSAAGASCRGQILKLVPRTNSGGSLRLFDVERISAGHRFPMGLARNRDGEIFVTDNQGNYNPFNELNHVRKGAHFGFINALEKEQGYKPPPLAEPAINIPHPWTRSVNGICFLETPVEWKASRPLAERVDHTAFGPWEGHLVGCEYDTRRLIRMSLQKIGDTYQGAAYPLSVPTEDVEKGLLGPIVCAVKPTTAELYVGEIRDSGWGAGNNIGQIVKIKIEPEKLPCGIAEVRATAKGFAIDFAQPVDRAKAADAANYSLESYRRESTPAYGGPDIDRRIEKIESIDVVEGGKRVALTLAGLRTGHVYELKLKNLAPGGGVFFPDEAHYTLHKIP